LPEVSQLVAAHAPPTAHAVAQQFPVPVVPHVPLAHWTGEVHAAPGARRHWLDAEHWYPTTHCELRVQLVLHDVEPHL
jgi:hypothetical protein